MICARAIRARLADETGAILVFWAVALVVVLGVTAMALDFGRIAATQSELQAYADHVALAAAGELDGNADAITRAQAAAANMIADSQTYGNGTKALAGSTSYTLDFFSSLPSNDTASMTAVTTNPRDAVFARISVTPKTVPYTIAAAFAALSGNALADQQVGAVAVAGFTEYACDVTPLMFCLPSPSFEADDNIGKMILLRAGGNGAAWGPGDFGFLDPDEVKVDPSGPCAGLSGAKLTQCRLAAVGSVTQCFSQRGVNTEPGQKVGVENPIFNVRFDMYQAGMKSRKTDPDYPAAANVIKGIVPKGGSSCIGNSSNPSTDTVGLPRDDCFASGTCPQTRFGDGNWSAGRTNYWKTNYGGTTDPFPAATTRYEYYLAEIAASGGGASSTPILTGRDETGRPHCSPNQTPDPGRRILIAAGIDCAANPINGRTDGVPVKEFVKLFLTEPVGDDPGAPSTIEIWAEIAGSAQAGGAGANGPAGATFHDVVQLYR